MIKATRKCWPRKTNDIFLCQTLLLILTHSHFRAFLFSPRHPNAHGYSTNGVSIFPRGRYHDLHVKRKESPNPKSHKVRMMQLPHQEARNMKLYPIHKVASDNFFF